MRPMRAALLIVFSVLAAAALVGWWPAADASLPVAPRAQSLPVPARLTVAPPAPVTSVVARRQRPIERPASPVDATPVNNLRPVVEAGAPAPALLSSKQVALTLPTLAPHAEAGQAMSGSLSDQTLGWRSVPGAPGDAVVEPARGAMTRGIVTAGKQISGAVTRAGRAIRAAF
jgi:hypothetical protein